MLKIDHPRFLKFFVSGVVAQPSDGFLFPFGFTGSASGPFDGLVCERLFDKIGNNRPALASSTGRHKKFDHSDDTECV